MPETGSRLTLVDDVLDIGNLLCMVEGERRLVTDALQYFRAQFCPHFGIACEEPEDIADQVACGFVGCNKTLQDTIPYGGTIVRLQNHSVKHKGMLLLGLKFLASSCVLPFKCSVDVS